MSHCGTGSSFLSSGNLRNRSHAAQKYLEKKFSKAKRFVVSSKIWLNTIPTRNTEVVILFPSTADDTTLMWVLSRIRSRVPALEVHVRKHSGSRTYGFYLTASYSQFLQSAEDIGLSKPLKKDAGGGFREFSFDDQEDFEGVEDSTQFLSSCERQSIISHLLNGLRAQPGDELGGIKFVEEQAIIPVLLSRKKISQVFPLHDHEMLATLNKTWVKGVWRSQPLDEICAYFGAKIGLYFAWLGHYTRALIFPALIGLAVFLKSGSNEAHDDVCFVLFSLLNIIWATIYLEYWKRRSCELSFNWGTLDQEEDLLVEPRHLYKGDLITSPVTGKLEPFSPPWKSRLVTYCIGLPITAACITVTMATTFLFFEFQEWLNSVISVGFVWSMIQFLPKIALAIVLMVYEMIYKRIALWVNEKENFRLEETYESNLIAKLTLFHFVNSFASLFYVAFYLQDMNRLRDLLAALLITRQIVSNVKELLIPFLHEKASLYKVGYTMTKDLSPDSISRELDEMRKTSTGESGQEEGDESNQEDAYGEGPAKLRLTQAEVESSKKQYDDAFDDYSEMFVQFGYVTFFSSAFPLAALFALINNLIEIRCDAFKLCNAYQRPFGKSVKNIGMWQDALELMSTFAVMINCVLIGMSGLVDRMFPNFSLTQTLLLIIVLEHVLLAVKFGIAYGIPDVPLWIKVKLAQMEYRRREALKKLEQQCILDNGSSNGNPGRRHNLQPPSADTNDCTGDPVTEVDFETVDGTLTTSFDDWNDPFDDSKCNFENYVEKNVQPLPTPSGGRGCDDWESSSFGSQSVNSETQSAVRLRLSQTGSTCSAKETSL